MLKHVNSRIIAKTDKIEAFRPSKIHKNYMFSDLYENNVAFKYLQKNIKKHWKPSTTNEMTTFWPLMTEPRIAQYLQKHP